MSDHFITAHELAAKLRKSTRTIYRMTSEDEIPYIRVGREYRYDFEAVIAKLTPSTEPTWKQSRRSTARKRVA